MSFPRRRLLINVLATMHLALATPVLAATKLEILNDLAVALGTAGDSIAKIGDGVAHLIELGDRGYGTVSARMTRNQLVKMSALTSQLLVSQQTGAYPSIVEFLNDPTPTKWQKFVANVSDILPQVRALIERVRQDRSDFVTTATYETLLKSLMERKRLLEDLSSIAPPSSPEELAALSDVAKNYDRLIKELQVSKNELNTYLAHN